jgi:hypothetical protein
MPHKNTTTIAGVRQGQQGVGGPSPRLAAPTRAPLLITRAYAPSEIHQVRALALLLALPAPWFIEGQVAA